MKTTAGTICPFRGCIDLKPCPNPAHAPKARRREIDKHRGSARERGYDARWEKGRKAWLEANPRCEHHRYRGEHSAGELVDHVIPHTRDACPKDAAGVKRHDSTNKACLFWDTSNWQSLCNHDHAAKGPREAGIAKCAHQAVKRVQGQTACIFCGAVSNGGSFQ